MALENIRGRVDRVFHPPYYEEKLQSPERKTPGYTTRFDSQGTQFRGMGEAFYNHSALARQIYGIASEEAGIDVAALSFGKPNKIIPGQTDGFSEDDTKAMLDKTRYAQIALAAYNATCLSEFRRERAGLASRRPNFGVGESWGFMAATYAAGGFGDISYLDSFRDFARVNVIRGRLMQEVCDRNPSRLVQLEVPETKAWSEVADIADSEDMEMAFDVSETVRRYGGNNENLNRANKYFEEMGIKVTPLSVSGKFHSKVFAQAGEEFGAVLEQFVRDLEYPILSNTTRDIRLLQSRADIVEEAVRIFSEPVYTIDINRYLAESGLASFKIGGRRTFGRDVQATPILSADQKKAILAGTALAGGVGAVAIGYWIKNMRKES